MGEPIRNLKNEEVGTKPLARPISICLKMAYLDPKQRVAGMLVPVFALRRNGDHGIGDTLAVHDAIDFCAENGFAVLQTLPIHETIGDHSPYNPVSSQALSPALLALTESEVPGLTKEMLRSAAPEDWVAQLREGAVKHNSVHPLKVHILLDAWHGFRQAHPEGSPLAEEFAQFQAENSWLAAYTLYRLLVREYEGNTNWHEWRPDHQKPESAEAWLARHPDRDKLSERRQGLAFIQWIAARQWFRVKAHAEKKGVLLMGEMSFGVGRSSVDVWEHRELFDLDWSMGTRPIVYFDTNKDSERWGQNWGLPAYRWENHRSTGFTWLRNRIRAESRYFHICRLDHLRGYFRGYMFPWPGGARHAEFAQLTEEEVRVRTGGRMPRFVPGPDEDPVTAQMNDLQGREIISVIREAAGDTYLFAEIMGGMPDYMRKALDDLAIPNLTFPQLERNPDRSLQPLDSFRVLSLASYANHDHSPLAAVYLHMKAEAESDPQSNAAIDLRNLLEYIGWQEPPPAEMNAELLSAFQRTLLGTPCQLACFMSSDVFGTPQRFNLPGSYGGETWCERLEFPLEDYKGHPEYGRRLATVRKLVGELRPSDR